MSIDQCRMGPSLSHATTLYCCPLAGLTEPLWSLVTVQKGGESWSLLAGDRSVWHLTCDLLIGT